MSTQSRRRVSISTLQQVLMAVVDYTLSVMAFW
jgi:hypothetical protein